MRKIAPFLFLLFGFLTNIFSQNTYTTLNPSEEVFFFSGKMNLAPYGFNSDQLQIIQSDVDTMFQGYRIDSIASDSLLYFNTIKRDVLNVWQRTGLAQNCDSSHWLGSHLIMTGDEEVYSNGLGEFLVYKTDARPGDTWTFHVKDTCIFVAEMDSTVYVDTILGTADSIFEISLQRYNLSGIPLDHQLNGRKIKIGQNSGFIKTIDHYHFPNDTNWYSLCGSNYPKRGITQPTLLDIYDFNVGDVFTYENVTGSSYPVWHYTTSYSSKQIDSIFYQDSLKCYGRVVPFCIDDSVAYRFVQECYDTNQIALYLPYEQLHMQFYQNGRHIIEFACHTPPLYTNDPSPLEECGYCSTDGLNETRTLVTGLGETHYSLADLTFSSSKTLIDFETGQGIPLDTLKIMCVSNTNNFESEDNSVEVFPIPTSQFLHVKSNTEIASWHIFNLSGQVLLSDLNPRPSIEADIDVNQLASGTFIIRVQTKEGIASKLFVVQ